jgi:hypothetical protein
MMSSKNLPVSVSIFPTLDAIELVQFNEKSGDIEKSASLPCTFDPATRQVQDRDHLVQAVRDLYNVNRIPFSTPAVLVLPSFFTREIDLPAEFSREELRFALVSEAERFYVFKKMEPQIDWVNLDKSRLLYSAFPKVEIDKYVQAFQELKIPLAAIELSYFSMIRGLLATGVLGNENITRGDRWCLLVISDNALFVSIQQGFKIQKTTDVPLSVSEDDDEGAISEIQQDFAAFTESETFSKLFFINNSRNINSQHVLLSLDYPAELILIEQNSGTLRSRGATDGLYPCSLEGIGGVFYRRFPELSGMNFLPEADADLAGLAHYRQEAVHWLLIANGGVFLLCLALWGVLTLLIWQKDQETALLAQQAGQLGILTRPGELADVERRQFTKKVADRNIAINNFLVKTGSTIQPEIWLEKLQLASGQPDQPWQATLEGKALKLDAVDHLLAELNKDADGLPPLEVGTATHTVSADGQSYFNWMMRSLAPDTPPKPGGV